MKKRLGLTVKTETVSGLVSGEKIGFQIVTGFSELSREPQATRVVNEKPVMEFPVYKELVEAMKRKAKHVVNYQAALKGEKDNISIKEAKVKELATREAEKPSLKGVELKDCECLIADCEHKITYHEKKIVAFNGKYKAGQAAAKLVDDELLEIGGRMKVAKDDHFRDNPVFCEPGKGQLIDHDALICVADSEGLPVTMTAAMVDADRKLAAEDDSLEHISMLVPEGMTVDKREVDGEMVDGLMQIFFAKGDNEQIKLDGAAVSDFRGAEYFYNDGDVWIKSEKITDLDVTKNTVVVDGYEDQACTWDQLEPEYKEQWRFQNLTPEQKQNEFDSMVSGLLVSASNLKNELEIKGDGTALTQSQVFYNEALAALKSKYGVTE